MNASPACRKKRVVAWQPRKDPSSGQLRKPRLHLDKPRGRPGRGPPQGLIESALQQGQSLQVVGFTDLSMPNRFEFGASFPPSLDPLPDHLALFHYSIFDQWAAVRLY